jgi:hypothetical protein
MTDVFLALSLSAAKEIEATARTSWDAMTGEDAQEYQAAMGMVRQAGALRRSIETWILQRATTGTTGRAAAVGDGHGR